MEEFTITKQISRQGTQSMILIPALLRDKLKPKMLVEVNIRIIGESPDGKPKKTQNNTNDEKKVTA